MSKKYKRGAFIFRRDLRIADNTGFLAACAECEEVIPCFIFDERQLKKNTYFSENAFQFLVESIEDLERQFHEAGGHAYMFYGKPERILERLIVKEEVEAVFVNRDYTPFSRVRDAALHEVCTRRNIPFLSYSDSLLHEPEEVFTGEKKHPYTQFSAFLRRARALPVRKPVTMRPHLHFDKDIRFAKPGIQRKLLKHENPHLFVNGGRSQGEVRLRDLKKFKQYATTRNFPALNATTGLSAPIKFGTLSIREVYWAVANSLGKNHALIDELYWRDFFTHIAFHFPHIFGNAFRSEYNDIPWKKNMLHFRAWCTGTTGFPIVDAGIRQLNTTGFMHNRIRMITASFLVKDLHIDWRWGEKYFASKLVDYDPSVNNGNWQWVASTGCDAQPFFRVFNPWLQQKKFDADCEYIRQWIPELRSISAPDIHNPDRTQSLGMYPSPMILHAEEAVKAVEMYKNV